CLGTMMGCQAETAVPTQVPTAILSTSIPVAALSTPLEPVATPMPTETAPPPATPPSQPTVTETAVPPTTLPSATPLPNNTATPTLTPSSTIPADASPTRTLLPIPTLPITTDLRCEDRVPANDLLVVITKTYGMSKTFTPEDLVPLSDYFPHEITLGYPTEVRAIIIDPLLAIMNDMKAAGLQPQLLSGYRSYVAQSIAFDKWLERYPDRASILSAPPGHSEHQLGTTVDFGSPELPDIVGENIQFHTHFYLTSEGIWLLENAHRYGFTLSYPREAIELTGFAYEPWHYRYVGIEMATHLKEIGVTLTEFSLISDPPPCIPINVN
ncbi:MAG: M15 family metallopeptidase, partial [Chloroflexi bacterium]|nr:M15 family metallopeptidase [Chloroflexota bacterium]